MPTDDHSDDLDPREEQVRRLLADARHAAPAPDDVVARMDAVLADLRSESDARPAQATPPRRAPAEPADLTAARRRRRVRAWVLAAAAVVVVGIGVDRVAESGLSGAGSDSSAGSSASSAEDDAAGGDKAVRPQLVAPGSAKGVVPLDRDGFGRQLQQLRGDLRPVPAESRAGTGGDTSGSLAQRDAPECRADGPGRAVAVRYDGEPGVVVFRPVHGDTQVVDLFLCSHEGPYRSITLPAP